MALELARGMAVDGHSAHVVALVDVDDYSNGAFAGVQRRALLRRDEYRWPLALLNIATRLREALKQLRPDVVESHALTATIGAALSGVSVPFVHVFHGYGDLMPARSLRERARAAVDLLSLRMTNAQPVALSQELAMAVARRYGMRLSEVAVLPNGIDTELFRYSERPDAKGAPMVCVLGTLARHKGCLGAVPAFAKLRHSMPGARMCFVGDGPLRKVLERQATELGLHKSVEVLGMRTDVPEILSRAHVLWHLSESEGCPLGILEAMATGLPVVAADVRGVREVVENGRTGILVKHGDWDALVEATKTILGSEAMRRALSEGSRARVEREFALKAMVAGHEQLARRAASSAKWQPRSR